MHAATVGQAGQGCGCRVIGVSGTCLYVVPQREHFPALGIPAISPRRERGASRGRRSGSGT
jgi:hypothetical protein